MIGLPVGCILTLLWLTGQSVRARVQQSPSSSPKVWRTRNSQLLTQCVQLQHHTLVPANQAVLGGWSSWDIFTITRTTLSLRWKKDSDSKDMGKESVHKATATLLLNSVTMIRLLLVFTVLLISVRGDPAQMNCSHNLGAGYYQMYWYKQNPPEGIRLIVFTTPDTSREFGKFSKDRYVAEKTVAERGSLTVKKLEAEDGGLVLSRKVHQSPAELVKDSGDSMQLNCSHAISSHDNILWYHQAAGDSALKLVGNASQSEPEYNSRPHLFSKGLENPQLSTAHTVCPATTPYSGTANQAVLGCWSSLDIFTMTRKTLSLRWKKDSDSKDMGKESVHKATATLLLNSVTMIRLLLIFTVLLISVRGVQNDVIMKPRILWRRLGDPAQMNCSHNLGAAYFQMYWYKQNPPEGIRLIVFTTPNTSPEFGNFSKDRYVAEKTVAERGSFTVKKLEAEDGGAYFCAVSTRLCRLIAWVNINLPVPILL
ncbi:hypothetical protein SKAU_G00331970 [Synaphobranchus kaupii]|uniref:Ig-like domain-containing protein n=1 Tax=Synaphobranchus kaupii TaxID=118154 RepID=A0A9Q1IIK5_SYNKA|nr:hypothetical protein SKAU_G00331970 [Synaphobranchus kaupii]